MRKVQIILLALGLGLCAWLFCRIGPHELWRELTLAGWGMAPMILGEGFAEMIHTVGWRHCLTGPLRRLPWGTLYRIRMAGYAINFLTPTAALGGEVVKGGLLAERHPGPEAASGVLIGKVCFALAHVLFVTIGAVLVLWRLHLPPPLRDGMIVSALILAGCMVTFLILQKYGKIGGILRWLAARLPHVRALQSITESVTSVDRTLQEFYREHPRELGKAMAWHLVGYSVGIVQTWFFFHALQPSSTLLVAAGAWFLGMWFDLLTFAVPMNLGTLEGTRILTLRAFGYTAVMGMAYGFALRLAQLFWSGFGLMAHWQLTWSTRAKKKNPASVASNTPNL